MLIAAKTGYGKSLIPTTIASVRKGVSIVLVPLIVIGLGSDQVAKAMHVDRGVEAYHIEGHKTPADEKLLEANLFLQSL